MHFTYTLRDTAVTICTASHVRSILLLVHNVIAMHSHVTQRSGHKRV